MPLKFETTLILGAGAGSPLFPTGQFLTMEILKTLHDDKNLFISLGFDESTIETFHRSLRLSQIDTIDEYLGINQKFLELGKAAISIAIMKHEDAAELDNSEKIPNWYKILWNKVRTILNNPNGSKDNKILIITFNYDRSIEEYLYRRILHTYTIYDNDPHQTKRIAEMTKRIKVIHVHGSLGLLPWQNEFPLPESSRPYNTNVNGETIKIACDGIKTIHDVDKDDTNLIEARILLLNSMKVFILGFGFHKTNVEKIGLHNMQGGNVFSTSYKLSQKTKDDNSNILFPTSRDSDCNDFLDHMQFNE